MKNLRSWVRRQFDTADHALESLRKLLIAFFILLGINLLMHLADFVETLLLRQNNLPSGRLILAMLLPAIVVGGLWFRHELKRRRKEKEIARLKIGRAKRFREKLEKAIHEGTLRPMTKPAQVKGLPNGAASRGE